MHVYRDSVAVESTSALPDNIYRDIGTARPLTPQVRARSRSPQLYACAPQIDGLGHTTRYVTNLIRPRCAEGAKPGQGKPVLNMRIGFFACFHAISIECSSFSKIAKLFSHPSSTEAVGIADMPPRSL